MAVIWHSASEKQIRYKTLSYHALTMLFYTGTILRAKFHLKETRGRNEYLVYELNVTETRRRSDPCFMFMLMFTCAILEEQQQLVVFWNCLS